MKIGKIKNKIMKATIQEIQEMSADCIADKWVSKNMQNCQK